MKFVKNKPKQKSITSEGNTEERPFVVGEGFQGFYMMPLMYVFNSIFAKIETNLVEVLELEGYDFKDEDEKYFYSAEGEMIDEITGKKLSQITYVPFDATIRTLLDDLTSINFHSERGFLQSFFDENNIKVDTKIKEIIDEWDYFSLLDYDYEKVTIFSFDYKNRLRQDVHTFIKLFTPIHFREG